MRIPSRRQFSAQFNFWGGMYRVVQLQAAALESQNQYIWEEPSHWHFLLGHKVITMQRLYI